MYLTSQCSRKSGVLILDQESASYFASMAKLQGLAQAIDSLQRVLPKLQAEVTSAREKFMHAEAILHACQQKLEGFRAQRDAILGRDKKLLTGGEQCQLTERSS